MKKDLIIFSPFGLLFHHTRNNWKFSRRTSLSTCFVSYIHFEDDKRRRQNDGSMEAESRINMRLMILPYCHLLHLLLLRKISHHCITWAVLSNAMEMKTDIFFRPATNFLVRLFNRRIFHQLAFVYFKPRQCQWFLFLFAATRDSLLA